MIRAITSCCSSNDVRLRTSRFSRDQCLKGIHHFATEFTSREGDGDRLRSTANQWRRRDGFRSGSLQRSFCQTLRWGCLREIHYPRWPAVRSFHSLLLPFTLIGSCLSGHDVFFLTPQSWLRICRAGSIGRTPQSATMALAIASHSSTAACFFRILRLLLSRCSNAATGVRKLN